MNKNACTQEPADAAAPTSPAVDRNSKPLWLRALPCLLLTAITAGAYVNARHSEFFFDDNQPTLLAIPAQNGAETARQFWHEPLRPGQQLTKISFALNAAINRTFGLDGLNVNGFLAFNVLLHGLNACLIYLLLRALLRQIEPDREPPIWIPAGLALLFAVHPIHGASVAYIIQRRGVLATTFYLLGILSWLRARRPVNKALSQPAPLRFMFFGAVSLLCYWLAYRSKEMALTLPLTILLVEFCLRAPKWSLKRYMGWLGAGIVLYGASMLLGLWDIGCFKPEHLQLSAYGESVDWGVWAHFLSMNRVLAHYWQLLLLPLSQWSSLDHDFAISWSLLQHGAGLALLLHVVLVAGAVVAIRKGLILGGLGVLFFYAVQLPYMLLPQWELYVEYKAYLPSIGVVLVLAQVWILLRTRIAAAPVLAGIGVLAAVLLVATISHNHIYQSALNMWSDAAAKAPTKFRPLTGVGEALLNQGKADEAADWFSRALSAAREDKSKAGDTRRFWANHNMACTLLKLNKPKTAARYFVEAARANQNSPLAMYDAGYALAQAGDLDGALYHYDFSLRLDPKSVRTHLQMADTLVAAERLADAELHYREAMTLEPDNAEVHSDLGKLVLMQGRVNESIEQFEQAIKLDPKLAEPHRRLADVLYSLEHTQEAFDHYRRALALDPNNPEACNNLATAIMLEGRVDTEVLDLYQRAVRAKPEYVLARMNLGDLLLRLDRRSEAVAQYQAILQIDPNHEPAKQRLEEMSKAAGAAASAPAK